MSERKLSFSPISVLGINFNPRNIPYIPVVEIFARLDLAQTALGRNVREESHEEDEAHQQGVHDGLE